MPIADMNSASSRRARSSLWSIRPDTCSRPATASLSRARFCIPSAIPDLSAVSSSGSIRRSRKEFSMASEALLSLHGVSKHFPGGVIGLKGIDLVIAEGEFLSLLGPSGCGKTTTLRVIAGFEGPTTGKVMLDGKDITPLRPYDRPVNTV